jgi:hypothetical protein
MTSFALTRQPDASYFTRRRQRLGGGLMLGGVILLVASLFVGWWSIQLSGFDITETLVLGFPATSGGNGVSFECSGNLSEFTNHCPSPETYSNASLSSTGKLYTAIQSLVFAGIVAGLLGVLLALGIVGGGNRRKLTIALACLAVSLALLAPVALTVAQPSAMNSDHPYGTIGSSATSPTNSFWGSNVSDGISYSWGASAGWYLALGAFVLILVGLIQFARVPKSTEVSPGRGYGSLERGSQPQSPVELGSSHRPMYRSPPTSEGIDPEESQLS